MLKTPAPPKMLIYTLTKNTACKVYEILYKSVNNSKCVSMYHASLTPATKAHIHSEFQKDGTLQCLVSTIAFGMVSSAVLHNLNPLVIIMKHRGWMFGMYSLLYCMVLLTILISYTR